MAYLPIQLKAQVALRAGRRCEYCHAPQILIGQPFHYDHAIPQVLGGLTALENLCFTCAHCNLTKGKRTQGVDPRTGQRARLFNPRTDVWEQHFYWSRKWRKLLGRTAIGRATIVALNLNVERLQRARPFWRAAGRIP